jgi:hypothetical protein
VDGAGLGAVVTASCAMAMLASKSSILAAVKILFIEILRNGIFKSVIGYSLRDRREDT